MNIPGPTPAGIPRVHGPHGINAPHAPFGPSGTEGTQRTQPTGDRLEISPAAEAAIRAAESDGVRTDLVSRIRAEIKAGSYETPEKLDAAVSRLLDEMG